MTSVDVILSRLHVVHGALESEQSSADPAAERTEIVSLVVELVCVLHKSRLPVSSTCSNVAEHDELFLSSGTRIAQTSLLNAFAWLLVLLQRGSQLELDTVTLVQEAATVATTTSDVSLADGTSGTKLLWCLSQRLSRHSNSALVVAAELQPLCALVLALSPSALDTTASYGDEYNGSFNGSNGRGNVDERELQLVSVGAQVEGSRKQAADSIKRRRMLVAAFGKVFDALSVMLTRPQVHSKQRPISLMKIDSISSATSTKRYVGLAWQF
jgi:hypothetical protein